MHRVCCAAAQCLSTHCRRHSHSSSPRGPKGGCAHATVMYPSIHVQRRLCRCPSPDETRRFSGRPASQQCPLFTFFEWLRHLTRHPASVHSLHCCVTPQVCSRSGRPRSPGLGLPSRQQQPRQPAGCDSSSGCRLQHRLWDLTPAGTPVQRAQHGGTQHRCGQAGRRSSLLKPICLGSLHAQQRRQQCVECCAPP